MIKIAIVEDNNPLRNSLESLFNMTEGMRCVASMSNLMNVVSEIGKASPDIILMDIGLPNISGIEGVRTVKSNFPGIQVMMFTVFDDDEKIFDAIRAGAAGYLLKKTPPGEIVQAILLPGRRADDGQYRPPGHPILPDGSLDDRRRLPAHGQGR